MIICFFPASDASFETVEALHTLVEGDPFPEKVNISHEQATRFLKQWAIKLGAKDIGLTQLKDYHKYTNVGRGPEYGKKVELDHPHAIALTVEMRKDMIDTAPLGPAIVETSHQYLESGEVAVQLAVMIRRLGFQARAHIDANYRVVCPLVARDAGLGEIGRMGLLMTPRQGPRVRIAVVTTDMPLLYDQRKPDPTMEDFCLVCKKCAVNCPSSAISFDEPKLIDGVKRWQINQEKCFTLWTQLGTDCGKCIAVCPYAHEDNLLHNIVRVGIRKNGRFRKVAALFDDLLYGKKPPSKPIPESIAWE